jgi:phage baseplate assembly protein V
MAETKQKRRYQSRHQFEVGIVSAQPLTPTPRIRVKFPDRQNLQSWWLPILVRNSQNNKDWWMPDVGEQVACLMDEAFRNGVVLGSFYQAVDAPPAGVTLHDRETLMRDGAIFKYDPDTHALTVSLPAGATAALTIASGQSLLMDSSGNVKILAPSGDIPVQTSEFNTSINAIITFCNTHVHSGVESGDDDTAVPTTQIP